MVLSEEKRRAVGATARPDGHGAQQGAQRIGRVLTEDRHRGARIRSGGLTTRSELVFRLIAGGNDTAIPHPPPRDLEAPPASTDVSPAVARPARVPVDPHDQHREQDREDEPRTMTMQHVPREETGTERAADADQRGHANPHGIWSWQQKPSERADEETDKEKDD
jgi:hypothetical protein